MADEDIHERIDALVAEEHRLRSAGSHTDDERARLVELESRLDQAWDLLRRRQALREAGADPAAARERSTAQVESYLQ